MSISLVFVFFSLFFLVIYEKKREKSLKNKEGLKSDGTINIAENFRRVLYTKKKITNGNFFYVLNLSY